MDAKHNALHIRVPQGIVHIAVGVGPRLSGNAEVVAAQCPAVSEGRIERIEADLCVRAAKHQRLRPLARHDRRLDMPFVLPGFERKSADV